MGNSTTKSYQIPTSISDNHVGENSRQKQHNQSGISSFIANLSSRSVGSYNSCYSIYSASRPWSRVSRRRWNNSTLSDPWLASKTAWPVPNVESHFLPEFRVDGRTNSRQFAYVDTVAKGAFGKVYKVRHRDTGKLYALKILSKSQIISENCVQQVKEEAHIQEVCGHNPFIVGFYLKWQTRKRLYIVTEYVSGGELSNVIERHAKLPEELVRIYVAQIGLVLDFLHNAGIIYRDLKPENLLLDHQGNIQLIDFGLSKWLKFGAKTSTICGTLNYIAPEVLSGQQYGHAVDWWSLGILIWKMLTNTTPSAEDMDVTQLEDASDAVKKLLQHLLSKDPLRRLRSLKTLQESAFFKSFDFKAIREMKVCPNDILKTYYPEGPTEQVDDLVHANENLFTNFDHLNIL